MEDSDLSRIRERYRLEREKRLRPDGIAQFITVDGEFAHYADDPLADPGLTRAPSTAEVDVVIAGAGITGMLCAAYLQAAGITNIAILEQGADFGGTWYWNRYPGAMCDVESYVYLPLLEETGYVPSQKYASGAEIRNYLQSLARRFNMYERAYLQTTITHVEWDAVRRRWRVMTDRHDELKARFFIVSNGPLTRPKLPGIAGIEAFKGVMFHTSRWNFDYTGGDTLGHLDRIHDKRVAVVGTGCTAVQCIPHLARSAEHLYVVQRTPASCDYRNNRPTDLAWWSENMSRPGWQRERMRNFTSIVSGGEEHIDMVDDGWTFTFQELTGIAARRAAESLGRALSKEERAHVMELADIEAMERIRNRIGMEVKDTETAELLKPWYKRWCKRPMWHDEYHPVFNLPNVTLVDTDGRGIDEVTEDSIVVGDRQYSVDCLIFATGFEVGTSYVQRIGYDIAGRADCRLSQKWANGMRTFHGLHVRHFPNMYFMGTTQTGVTPNYTHEVAEQAEHVTYIISELTCRGNAVAEATQDAEDGWVAEIFRLARHGRRYYEECTPGYLTAEGKLDDPYGLLANTYGLGPVRFFQLLADWRKAGGLDGLEVM